MMKGSCFFQSHCMRVCVHWDDLWGALIVHKWPRLQPAMDMMAELREFDSRITVMSSKQFCREICILLSNPIIEGGEWFHISLLPSGIITIHCCFPPSLPPSHIPTAADRRWRSSPRICHFSFLQRYKWTNFGTIHGVCKVSDLAFVADSISLHWHWW